MACGAYGLEESVKSTEMKRGESHASRAATLWTGLPNMSLRAPSRGGGSCSLPMAAAPAAAPATRGGPAAATAAAAAAAAAAAVELVAVAVVAAVDGASAAAPL
eukprot:1381184-Pleurochrysis_carterae.AAC.1